MSLTSILPFVENLSTKGLLAKIVRLFATRVFWEQKTMLAMPIPQTAARQKERHNPRNFVPKAVPFSMPTRILHGLFSVLIS